MAKNTDQNDEFQRTIDAMRADSPRYTVSTAEAANLLGISASTLRKWVKDGRASGRTIGGKLLFTRDVLRRLFRGACP